MSGLAAILPALGAVALAVWGLVGGRFRDAEGFYEGIVILPLAVAFALLFSAWALRRRSPKLALYGGLFFAGQGASLQLILCGNKIGYQHYYTLDRIVADAPAPALAIIGLEVVLAVVGLRPFARDLLGWIRRELTTKQILAVGFVFFITSSTLSKNPADYVVELFVATFMQALHLLVLIIAARSASSELVRDLGGRAERFLNRAPAGPDQFAWIAGLFVAVVAALLSWFSYERHPHIPDEVVYLYHARYFAEGLLTMPLPPAAEAFNVDLMMYDGGVWYCPVPLGWPSMLAVGAYFGAEWLVNPILAGLTVVIAHGVLRGVYGNRTARLGTILVATSPWFVFLAMSFMTHTFTMFAAVTASYALMRLWKRPARVGWAILCGAFIGVVSLIRPLEGLAAAMTFGLWALSFGAVRRRVVNVVTMGLSSAAVAAVQFPYNKALTGDPFKFPIMLYTDKMYGKDSNALGFGPNRGLGWTGLDPFPGHGAIDVAVNANLNLFQINCELLGWAIGSMLLLAFALFSRQMRRVDWGFFAGAFVIVFLHSFYWFSGGPDFGARYWFLTFLPGIVLSVRGFEILSSRLAEDQRKRGVLAVGALVLGCTVVFFPWRAVDKYHHYRLMRPGIRRLAEEHHFGKSLVIVRGNRHPDYASSVTYNPIDFSDPVPIYAWDQDRADLRAKAVEAYPDRPVYIVDGPSITGRGFELRAGPLRGIEAVERAIAEGK